MMELLKQDVYAPVAAEKQVCSFYAGGKWFLDTLDVEKVGKFEDDLYTALDKDKKILEAIKAEKVMSESTEQALVKIIEKVVELNK
jgi:F-type H+-transporting ATPase subunit alpha